MVSYSELMRTVKISATTTIMRMDFGVLLSPVSGGLPGFFGSLFNNHFPFQIGPPGLPGSVFIIP